VDGLQDKEDKALTISQGDNFEHEEDDVNNEPDLENFRSTVAKPRSISDASKYGWQPHQNKIVSCSTVIDRGHTEKGR